MEILCTYSQVINYLKTLISSTCINISNYAGLPACFKPNFSYRYEATNGTYTLHNNWAYRKQLPVMTAYISNPITECSFSTMSSQLDSFIRSIVPNINARVSTEDFFNLINNLMSFCSCRLFFTCSYLHPNTYVIYNQGNVSYFYKEYFKGSGNTDLIREDHVNDYINSLFYYVKNSIRNRPCTYTYVQTVENR